MPQDDAEAGRPRSVLININDARLLPRRDGTVGSVLREALITARRRFGFELVIIPNEEDADVVLMGSDGWSIRIVDHRGQDCPLDGTLLPVAQFLCSNPSATDESVRLLRSLFEVREPQPGKRRGETETVRDALRFLIHYGNGFRRMPDDWDPEAPENQGNPPTTE